MVERLSQPCMALGTGTRGLDRMKDGKPTGVYQDFMTGFVLDKSTVWAGHQGYR
jgi:hypothetical protein